jgi:hypothetical protein
MPYSMGWFLDIKISSNKKIYMNMYYKGLSLKSYNHQKKVSSSSHILKKRHSEGILSALCGNHRVPFGIELCVDVYSMTV